MHTDFREIRGTLHSLLTAMPLVLALVGCGSDPKKVVDSVTGSENPGAGSAMAGAPQTGGADSSPGATPPSGGVTTGNGTMAPSEGMPVGGGATRLDRAVALLPDADDVG